MKRFILIFVVVAAVIGIGTCAFILNNCPDSVAAAKIREQRDQVWPHVVSAYEWCANGVVSAWDWCKSKLPEKSETPAPAEAAAEEATDETVADVDETQADDENPEVEEPTALKYPWSFSKANWYGGRGLVTKDVKGKTVMVYLWNREVKDSVEILPRIEQVWSAYKHLPIMVVASHRGGLEKEGKIKEVEKLVKKNKLSFPNFEGAGFKCEPRGISHYPYLYVINPKGKVIYRGSSDREATGALVNAIDFNAK